MRRELEEHDIGIMTAGKKRKVTEDQPPETASGKPGKKRRMQEATEVVAAALAPSHKADTSLESPSVAPKPKRKRATAEFAQPVAEAPTKSVGSSSGKKRNKMVASAGGDGVAARATAPEEDARRKSIQKQVQELVVKMRAEGKSEAEIGAAKAELKRKAGPVFKPDGHRAKKAQAWKEKMREVQQSEEGKADRKAKLQKEHDLVVIPVIWRGRHDHWEVLRAAEDIKALVAQHNVDVWLDSRRHYSPGQKFAHWEYRGVMLRVEVGPEDLKAGVCRVCKATTPGDHRSVQRKTVRLPPKGARTLLVTLKEWGLPGIEVERRKGDSDDEAELGDQPVSTKDEVAASAAGRKVADEDLEGNWEPALPTKQRENKPKSGGKKGKRNIIQS